MNKSFLYTLLLCIVGTNLYSMEEGCDSPNNNRISEYRINKSPEIPSVNPGKEEVDSVLGHDEREEDLIESFQMAPPEIKGVVNLIKNNQESRNFYKCLILTGIPGAGKTLLSKAICRELGRPYEFILTSTLLGHIRNQASKRIKEKFLEWEKSKQRPVLIFDEIMSIFKGYESESTDIQEASSTFWQCFDIYCKYEDFFLIGTANNTTDMDLPLQDRFDEKIFVMKAIALDARVRKLKRRLSLFNDVEIDSTLDDAFIKELAEQLENFSYRNLEALIFKARRISNLENPNRGKILLSKRYFEMALTEWKHQHETIFDSKRKAPAEDKRHRESMEQHEKHHQESAQQSQQQHQENRSQQENNQSRNSWYFWIQIALHVAFSMAGAR